MKSLFISYASDDGAGIAQYFDERLKGAGVNVFRDKSGLKPGDFEDQLFEKIREHEVFLTFVTPGALKSQWVLREIGFAKEIGKTIIAFRCWQKALPEIISKWEAPYIESDSDKLFWVKSLDKTLSNLEEGEKIPRAISFSKQKPIEGFSVIDLLVLLNSANDIDLSNVNSITGEAFRMADLYFQTKERLLQHRDEKIELAYIPPSLGGVASCLAACLAGENVFPTIFPLIKEGDRFKTDRAIGIQTQNLRDGFRKKLQDF